MANDHLEAQVWSTALDAWVLQLTVVGMLPGMSEAGGPRDKAQVLKAAPQLAGAAAQKPQRALQDKPRHGGGRAR